MLSVFKVLYDKKWTNDITVKIMNVINVVCTM